MPFGEPNQRYARGEQQPCPEARAKAELDRHLSAQWIACGRGCSFDEFNGKNVHAVTSFDKKTGIELMVEVMRDFARYDDGLTQVSWDVFAPR